jgi:hypothetical protein
MNFICATAELGITAIRVRLELFHSIKRTNCFLRFRSVPIGTRPESRFIPNRDQTGIPVHSKLGSRSLWILQRRRRGLPRSVY